MPVTHFTLRWPDHSETLCYSPSSVVREHLATGRSYPLDAFLVQAGSALHAASERVRDKYGFACSQALDQLAQIEQAAARFQDQPGAVVVVVAID